MRKPPALWFEYDAQRSPQMLTNDCSTLACCEWARLLVGRSLALAQCRDGTSAGRANWQYLVLGVPWADMKGAGDEEGCRLALAGVDEDFLQLSRSIKVLRDSLEPMKNTAQIKAPEAFLRSFHLVMALRLPCDVSNWIVTDEGLAIIRWGLDDERDRKLLLWSDEQLNSMKSKVLHKIGASARQPGGRPGSRAWSGTSQALNHVVNRVKPAPGEVSRDVPARSMRWLPWLLAVVFATSTVILASVCFKQARNASAVKPVQQRPQEDAPKGEQRPSSTKQSSNFQRGSESPGHSVPMGEDRGDWPHLFWGGGLADA